MTFYPDNPIRGRRSAQLEVEREHFHDENQDGFYNIEEAHELIRSGDCGNYEDKTGKFAAEFDRMDKNKDRKLSYEEING